jgi:hypothetical protein
MSADLYNKKKKGYTTVLVRFSTGAQPKVNGSTQPRVRFFPERATPKHLKASLQALQASCSY